MQDLIGLMIAVMIGATLMPNLVTAQQHSLDLIRTAATAGQMMEISNAANEYIEANYPALEAAGGTQTVSISQLETAGDLSPAVSPLNPYGQTWEVQISQPVTGRLQGVIISTGGTALSQPQEGEVVAQTNGVGGFIPYASMGSTNTALGAYGGWQISMAPYTNPGSGHLVGLLSYDNGQQVNNDYLYRVSVPGQPQLNTMQASLNMGGNNVTNASNISATNQISAYGTSQSDLPPGWGGGLTTWDLHADASIGSGPAGQAVQAVLSDAGTGGGMGTGGAMSLTSPNGQDFVGATATNNGANVSTNGNISAGPNGGGCVDDSDGHCEGEVLTAGTNENELPPGWNGGIVTRDLYSQDGTIAVGNNQHQLADLSDYANGSAGSGGVVALTSPNGVFYGNTSATNTQSSSYVSNSAGSYAELSVPDSGNNDAFIATNGNIKVYNPNNGSTSFYAYNDGAAGVTGQFDLATNATAGTGCSPNGAISASYSGAILSCVNGVWSSGSSSFTQAYQTGVNNGQWYQNTGSGPMFVATHCNNTPYSNANGYVEGVWLTVYTPTGAYASTSSGQVQEGGSDANFSAAPSASTIVPSGYYFSVSGTNMACTVDITQ